MASADPTRARRLRLRVPSAAHLALGLGLAPLVVLAALRRASDTGALVRVDHDQAAVVVDFLRGEERVVTTPGNVTLLPFLQEAYILDRGPKELRFEGNQALQASRAPRLLVRASDGSSFWFGSFALQYAVDSSQAGRVVEDCGPSGSLQRDLVHGYARAILRDEMGRYSTEEIVTPENLSAATRAAQERLERALAPHGILVRQLATPQPGFDERYEQAIERRKLAKAELEHLRAKIAQLEKERDQRVARVRREKEVEWLRAEGELKVQRLEVERNAIRVRHEADLFHEKRASEARLALQHKLRQAEALAVAIRAEAETARAQLAALEAQGEVAVRAALVERLAKIQFDFAPYAREQAGAAQASAKGAP